MNLNIIGYFVYLSITAFIIIFVGKICYTNGTIFVKALVPGHEELCQHINQILLIGYYLINLGYCGITLISWTKINTTTELLETIALKSAIIILLIAILHYLNITIILNYLKKIIH